MLQPKSNFDDQRLEQILGNLLRAGVIVSSLVVLLGGILYLRQSGVEVPDFRTFHGQPAELRHPFGVAREAAALDGRGVIQFGLLLLIGTPVARVLFSFFGFALQRDRMYMAITLVVLAILIGSLLQG